MHDERLLRPHAARGAAQRPTDLRRAPVVVVKVVAPNLKRVDARVEADGRGPGRKAAWLVRDHDIAVLVGDAVDVALPAVTVLVSHGKFRAAVALACERKCDRWTVARRISNDGR